MQTTIMGYIGIIRYIMGLYRDTGKENGSYSLGFRVYGLAVLAQGFQ